MAFARACGLCLLLVAGVAASQRGGTAPRGFEAAVDAAASLTRLRSLLVAVRGEVVEERYCRGAAAARPANVKSVSKSIIGLLVGLAIDRGHIKSVRDPISRYLPPQTGAVAGKGAITIEDFLTMRSGLETTSNRNYGRWVQQRQLGAARPAAADGGRAGRPHDLQHRQQPRPLGGDHPRNRGQHAGVRAARPGRAPGHRDPGLDARSAGHLSRR